MQVLSNNSTTEFPENAPHSFKNRLPYPLQFKEEGWKVGLTCMTYPTPPVHPHVTHFPFDKNDQQLDVDLTGEDLNWDR